MREIENELVVIDFKSGKTLMDSVAFQGILLIL